MERIDLTKPAFDQNTFTGRAKHFFLVANPLNILKSPSELDYTKSIITRHQAGEDTKLTDSELQKAKYVYDSAFHPDTGEKMMLIGRMSAQVPMNMTITGCMLQFYKTTPQVVFWQWINQSFNAIVNYTNRSGSAPIPRSELLTSYALATTGAVTTAVTLNKLVQHLPSLVARFVPFVAVSCANCINIPFMRRKELERGVSVYTDEGHLVGESSEAAKKGIREVLISRNLMALPGMALPPLLMNALEKRGHLAKRPWIGGPLQIALCGLCLCFATPLCCALFPQRSALHIDKLDSTLKAKAKELDAAGSYVYFNKGL